MTNLMVWTQKATEHKKSCESCKNRQICDEAAQINAKVMEAALFSN